MKIDFYDFFSHYVPDDFSEAGSENYVTAVIKKKDHTHYRVDEIIDVDSVKKIIVGDTTVHVK